MEELSKFKRGQSIRYFKRLPKSEREVIDDFVKFVSITSKSQQRLDNNRRNLLTFRKTIKKPLNNVDLSDLRSFLSLVNRSGRTQSSKNDLNHTIKRFLKWNFKDWSERFSNLEDIKLIIRMNEEKINADSLIRKEDVEKIIKAESRLLWKTFFISLYESGLRPIELRTLTWDKIRFDIDGNGISEINVYATKTSRARTVYVKEATFYLKKLKENSKSPLVFPSPKDSLKPISKELASVWLGSISQKVLGRKVYPYILRHSRATELYTNAAIPDKTVQKFLGHSKSMSDIYTHLSNKDVRDAVSKTIYNTEDISPKKKHRLEKEVEELKKKIEDMSNYGKIADQIFKDKNMQKALLETMIKNGFGKQLLQLSGN